MKCLVCVEQRGSEGVVGAAARYLPDDSELEVVIVCVVDEAAPRGHGLLVRGLLGRGPRRSDRMESTASEEVASEVLAEAAALFERLRPGASVGTLVARGRPGEELVKAAREGGFEAVFIGRGSPGEERPEEVSGVVAGWKTNHHGDRDGLYLEAEGEVHEVRFPPHRAAEVERVIREGSRVEARGVRRGGHLHAHEIADSGTGESVEAHRPPGREPEKKFHLGHTARFLTDHVSCDVVLLT